MAADSSSLLASPTPAVSPAALSAAPSAASAGAAAVAGISARTLLQLAPGEKATIAGVVAAPELAPRLAALGFREGALIELIRCAPFAGPLHLRLGTTDVIMRRQDARSVLLAA